MITRKRLFIRLCSFFTFLLLAEIFVRATVPEQNAGAFNAAYRFPPSQEYIYLPELVSHIKSQKKKEPQKKLIVFSGSSPTYGHKIQNPENTYPFSFEKASKQNSRHPQNIQVFNTASDGQLVSDQYYIVRSLIHDADYFYIQLNYHTFNPQTLREAGIRHKEMPEKLGVKVTEKEAGLLNRRTTPVISLSVPLQNMLKKVSRLYRERETLPFLLFGGKPEDMIYEKYANWRGQKSAQNNEGFLSQALPFSRLSPQKQLVIVKRYSERCHFKLKDAETNSELFFLKRMTRLLKKYKKPAVFFITPLNRDALDAYEMMNWMEYKNNVKSIRGIVENEDILFLDFNEKHAYPENLFFDISHTLDAGGEIVGKDLFSDTKTYLENAL